MNTWTKLDDGAWGVQCPTPHDVGATVTVTNKAGVSKTVVLGAKIKESFFGTVYAVGAAPKAAAVTVGELSGLLALFDRAKCNSPALVVAIPAEADPCRALFTYRLSVAGETAKVPGSLTVTDGVAPDWNSGERREWFGRVLRSGVYEPSSSANGRADKIAASLKALALDPAKAARESARLTGKCIFCNIRLTQGKSTAVGYGETCAANYGLPWGEVDCPF